MDDFAFKRLGDLEHPTMMEFRFPLRPDCMVTMWLPRDLKNAEAEKLTKIITALAESITG